MATTSSAASTTNAAMSTSWTLRKRPHHQSPSSSYTSTTHERSCTSKRPRWDISSPLPSPPLLSRPSQKQLAASQQQQRAYAFATSSLEFNFGLQAPNIPAVATPLARCSCSFLSERPHKSRSHRTCIPNCKEGGMSAVPDTRIVTDDDDDVGETGTRIRSALAFDRLRRSALEEGEVFVNRMREWEQAQEDKRRILPRRERNDDGSSIESTSSPSTSSPSMSTSITSNYPQSTASSHLLSIPTASGRKRSWSIVEGDDGPSSDASEGGEMDWEVLPTGPIPPRNGIAVQDTLKDRRGGEVQPSPESLVQAHALLELVDDGAQDGDDEQDEEGEDEESDDDDLVFVIGTVAPDTQGTAPTWPTPEPTRLLAPNGTERMLSELSQVLAAGGGGLLETDDRTPEQAPMADAGSLW